MDQQKAEPTGDQANDNRRAERRLARGLEDVSHLFQAQHGEVAPAPAGLEEASPRNAPVEPSASADATILRPSSAVSRGLLISLLSKHTAVLEDALQSIDTDIPCDSGGTIDLLAVDGLNQLVIVDIDACPGDGLLLRGISHFDWFVRNTPIVRRMYRGRTINFSTEPRLFLVAPDFSPMIRCVSDRIGSPRICCLRYRAVAIPNGPGVLFERLQ